MPAPTPGHPLPTRQCPECHGNALAGGIGPTQCTTCLGTGKVPPPLNPGS